jgi:hypothetical protein
MVVVRVMKDLLRVGVSEPDASAALTREFGPPRMGVTSAADTSP